MKFNVEVELNNAGYDEALDEVLIDKVTDALVNRIENEFYSRNASVVSKQVEKVINAKVNMMIETLLEKPISITKSWNNEEEFESIYDMVEQKMSELYLPKISGKATCDKDKVLMKLENHINQEAVRLIDDTDKKIKAEAYRVAKEAYAENEILNAIGARVKSVRTRNGLKEEVVLEDRS